MLRIVSAESRKDDEIINSLPKCNLVRKYKVTNFIKPLVSAMWDKIRAFVKEKNITISLITMKRLAKYGNNNFADDYIWYHFL